ncbi:MAG: hypothetical protein U0X92_12530 [Anaerolineales bacterium]
MVLFNQTSAVDWKDEDEFAEAIQLGLIASDDAIQWLVRRPFRSRMICFYNKPINLCTFTIGDHRQLGQRQSLLGIGKQLQRNVYYAKDPDMGLLEMRG